MPIAQKPRGRWVPGPSRWSRRTGRPDVARILGAALPPRHGEAGHALREMWRIGRRHWDRLFLELNHLRTESESEEASTENPV